MKKIQILGSIIAMGFLIGCGGGGSSSSDTVAAPVDQMTERDLVMVFYHAPRGMCENIEFQTYLKNYITSEGYVVDYWLFREENNNVNCGTYNRIITAYYVDNGACVTQELISVDSSYSEYDTSCVIGIDANLDITTPAKEKHDENTIVSEITSAISQY